MHQSPQKPFVGRRDRYFDRELADSQADRRPARENPPKARKFQLRDELEREARWDKHYAGK
jgi:hypothetical protein